MFEDITSMDLSFNNDYVSVNNSIAVDSSSDEFTSISEDFVSDTSVPSKSITWKVDIHPSYPYDWKYDYDWEWRPTPTGTDHWTTPVPYIYPPGQLQPIPEVGEILRIPVKLPTAPVPTEEEIQAKEKAKVKKLKKAVERLGNLLIDDEED